MPDVDVLVVGAGPAGAVAAWEAKRALPELEVVLLERDPAVGSPVRCAEGVGDAGLREFADPNGADWAARKITRVIFLAPDDTEVRVAERDVGWVLDREHPDRALVLTRYGVLVGRLGGRRCRAAPSLAEGRGLGAVAGSAKEASNAASLTNHFLPIFFAPGIFPVRHRVLAAGALKRSRTASSSTVRRDMRGSPGIRPRAADAGSLRGSCVGVMW